MNRKFLAGAAASLMLTSLPVAITSAGAAASGPTISSISVNHVTAKFQFGAAQTAFAGGANQAATSIAPFETADITLNGAGFVNSATYNANKLTITAGSCKSPALGNNFKVNSVTRVSDTQVIANVTAGNPDAPNTLNSDFFMNSGKYGACKGAQLDLKVGAATATAKKALELRSNCGTTLPTSAAPGFTYKTVDDVVQPGVDPVSSPATTYFDVSVNASSLLPSVTSNNLCADDLGSQSAGTPIYAVNYPVSFVNSGAANLHTDKHHAGYGTGSIDGVGFTFPYTSSRILTIYGTSVTYNLGGVKAINTCNKQGITEPDGQTGVSCTLNGAKGFTVTSSSSVQKSKGDTIYSPLVNLRDIGAKSSPVTVTPVSASSEIGIGTTGGCVQTLGVWGGTGDTLCLAIVFAPRAKSASATYAPISFAAGS